MILASGYQLSQESINSSDNKSVEVITHFMIMQRHTSYLSSGFCLVEPRVGWDVGLANRMGPFAMSAQIRSLSGRRSGATWDLSPSLSLSLFLYSC